MALFFCPQLEYHSYYFKSNYLPGLRILVSEGVPLGLLNVFAMSILDYPPPPCQSLQNCSVTSGDPSVTFVICESPATSTKDINVHSETLTIIETGHLRPLCYHL